MVVLVGFTMSLHDFWISVKLARDDYLGQVAFDAGVSPGGLEHRNGWNLWLTSNTVRGFDEADFDFLPEDRRAELSLLVQKFGEAASRSEEGWLPTLDAVEEGRPLMERLIEIMDFERYPDFDAFLNGKRVEKALGRDAQPEIADMRFRTGRDYAGTKTFWIDVTLSEEVSRDDRRFLEVARPLDWKLNRIARRVAPDLWPHISIRAAAEGVAAGMA